MRTGDTPNGPANAEFWAWEHGDDASEFCWGLGLTPKGLEDAPPAWGGRYHGTPPPPQERVGLSRDMRG